MILFKSKKRLITLLIILFSGIIVFFFGLGSTGLVDETPPLFASKVVNWLNKVMQEY